MRNKSVFPVIIVLMVLSVILCTQTQPVMGGGAGGGMGGGRGGGRGGGMGAEMGGGMGMMGGGRAMAATQRPDKTTRLAAIADIEKQITALKAVIDKSQAKDPCTSTLSPEALTAYTAQYTEESQAITQIVTALITIRPAAGGFGGGGRGGMMGGAGLTTEQITELTTIAKGEKAPKTTAKLEALAKEAEAAASRGGGGNRGGYTPPAGGFKYED